MTDNIVDYDNSESNTQKILYLEIYKSPAIWCNIQNNNCSTFMQILAVGLVESVQLVFGEGTPDALSS